MRGCACLLVGAMCIMASIVGAKHSYADEAKAEKRPNIVIIYTDDHAYQAIGAYGQKLLPDQESPTPQLDRLAREGMTFTNCCVPNSICGPMRAVVQTGKYSHKNGFLTNDGKGFDNTQTTFPKLLQKAGYATAIIGKWHLKCDARPGFDYADVLIGQGPYFNPPMIQNGTRVVRQGYTTEIITQLSIDWMERGRDPSKPFLLMCHHKATHRNWIPTPKYYDRFKDREFPLPETFWDDYSGRGTAARTQDMTIARTMNANDLKLNGPPNGLSEAQKKDWHDMYDSRVREYQELRERGASEKEMTQWKYQCYMRDYLAVAAAVDDSVGEILDYLEKSGLAENTIVIYSSDQGFYLGEHGWFDKRFMYEQSFKTALIARWSGVIASGTKSDAIVSPIDFAETFLDVAGAEIPRDMQGASMLPIWRGEVPQDWRTSFYYHYYEFPAEHSVKRHEGVYDGRFKLIHFYHDVDEWELYDLQNDPNELENIFAKPGMEPVVARMKAALVEQKKELGAPENPMDQKL